VPPARPSRPVAHVPARITGRPGRAGPGPQDRPPGAAHPERGAGDRGAVTLYWPPGGSAGSRSASCWRGSPSPRARPRTLSRAATTAAYVRAFLASLRGAGTPAGGGVRRAWAGQAHAARLLRTVVAVARAVLGPERRQRGGAGPLPPLLSSWLHRRFRGGTGEPAPLRSGERRLARVDAPAASIGRRIGTVGAIAPVRAVAVLLLVAMAFAPRLSWQMFPFCLHPKWVEEPG
jgi:hypothetical protein